jgi:hypothetical protein
MSQCSIRLQVVTTVVRFPARIATRGRNLAERLSSVRMQAALEPPNGFVSRVYLDRMGLTNDRFT